MRRASSCPRVARRSTAAPPVATIRRPFGAGGAAKLRCRKWMRAVTFAVQSRQHFSEGGFEMSEANFRVVRHGRCGTSRAGVVVGVIALLVIAVAVSYFVRRGGRNQQTKTD